MVELVGDVAAVVRRDGAAGVGGLGGVEARRDREATAREGTEGDATREASWASGIGAS